MLQTLSLKNVSKAFFMN